MTSAVNSTVLSSTSTYYSLYDEVNEESSNIGLIIGLVFASLVLVGVGIFTFVYCVRRRGKITEMPINDEESIHDKEGNNPVVMISESRPPGHEGLQDRTEHFDKDLHFGQEERFD